MITLNEEGRITVVDPGGESLQEQIGTDINEIDDIAIRLKHFCDVMTTTEEKLGRFKIYNIFNKLFEEDEPSRELAIFYMMFHCLDQYKHEVEKSKVGKTLGIIPDSAPSTQSFEICMCDECKQERKG